MEGVELEDVIARIKGAARPLVVGFHSWKNQPPHAPEPQPEPQPEPEPAHLIETHRFAVSAELQRAVELRRPGRWAELSDADGIVDENDEIYAEEGFELSGGEWQAVPTVPAAELVACPEEAPKANSVARCRFGETEVCVADCDTLSAALAVGDACALNFANADEPGGLYRAGATAQEEVLCRLLPQLYPSLLQAEEAGHYPLPAHCALLSRNLVAVRHPGSYDRCDSLAVGKVTVVSAAMPLFSGTTDEDWHETVTLRIRAALHAAARSGHSRLVLGAFGCGKFGNPPELVAVVFRQQLSSAEFRGCFEKVVFAIIDDYDNLEPFQQDISKYVS